MIVYLDTSACVPLLVAEPTSGACQQLWDAADDVVGTRLLHVEASAAVAAAERSSRLSGEQAAGARSVLDDLWSQVSVVELDGALMREASLLALRLGLRGYDAVHCAAAVSLHDPDLVAASGDRDLLRAWTGLGVAIFDPHGPPSVP